MAKDDGVIIEFGDDKGKKKKAKGPPRHIVKSGNAGNSASSSAKNSAVVPTGNPSPQTLLFPGWTGKTPLTLLNEHCQRMGWERPSVDVKRLSRALVSKLEGNFTSSTGNGGATSTSTSTPPPEPGYTATITLRRKPHKKSPKQGDEVAQLKPHPPTLINKDIMSEARHWGATFALFSVANHLSLAFALPPPCRDFWSDLQSIKKKSPASDAWRWQADPFAAATLRQECKEVMAEKREARSRREALSNGQGTLSDEEAETKRLAEEEEKLRKAGKIKGDYWSQLPTIHMAVYLRDLVESTVKDGYERFPLAGMQNVGATSDQTSATFDEKIHAQKVDELTARLSCLSMRDGFRKGHVQSAIRQYASARRPLDDTEMAKSWCTDWLLTYLPEDDLPARYRRSAGKGLAPDQTIRLGSAGQGHEGLVQEWLVDRVALVSGISRTIVQAQCRNLSQVTEAYLVDHLLRRLTGWDWPWHEQELPPHRLVQEELMTLEAIQGDRYRQIATDHVAIDVKTDKCQLVLHYYPHQKSKYLQDQSPPTICVANFSESSPIPAYVRLFLTKTLLLQCRDDPEWSETLESSDAGGIIGSMIEWLHSHLDEILDHPPDVSEVMAGLIPRTAIQGSIRGVDSSNAATNGTDGTSKKKRIVRDQALHLAQLKSQRDHLRENLDHQKVLNQRQRLPAAKLKNDFLQLVSRHQVVVVMGSTGCGKTTQLPQFLLDDHLDRNESRISILVTQPRRVSAIGVAERVASERGEQLGRPGTSVGYAIRGERKASSHTNLLFCTTGIALRRLAVGDGLEDVTHVVVDEVHERSVDGDTLLLELKDLMHKRKDLKIILMSATIEEALFSQYFDGAPTLSISGFTFGVTEYFLEDILERVDYRPPPGGSLRNSAKTIAKERRAEYTAQGLAGSSIEALEHITCASFMDYNLIVKVIQHIQTLEEGAILIFLSGVQEIKACCNLLKAQCQAVRVLPLHANLPTSEQSLVFRPVPAGLRKIVVATNVAQTSITIEDIVFVIDSGKVKETRFDIETGLTRLVETWVSRADATQRQGRAGRVRPGQCFKLFSRATKKIEMVPHQTPEMLRVPLEQLLLQVKAVRADQDAAAFLARAITPPDTRSIEKSQSLLEDLGAVDSSDQLTAVGRWMSMIPVDLRLAKMMILGSIFECLDPILTCAAILSAKPLFLSPLDQREEAKAARSKFYWATSDLLTDVKAYDEYSSSCDRGELITHAQRTRYSQENFLSMSSLRDISLLRNDFHDALSEIGITTAAKVGRTSLCEPGLLKTIIYAGLYPNLARVQTPKARFDKVMTGTIQREIEARQVKFYTKQDGRVFIHPSSVVFSNHRFQSPFVTYFAKSTVTSNRPGETDQGPKIYLRDATEVPTYALILFAQKLVVDYEHHALSIDDWLKFRAWTRIGVLANHLKRLLDSLLDRKIEEPGLDISRDPIVTVMRRLLERDGL